MRDPSLATPNKQDVRFTPLSLKKAAKGAVNRQARNRTFRQKPLKSGLDELGSRSSLKPSSREVKRPAHVRSPGPLQPLSPDRAQAGQSGDRDECRFLRDNAHLGINLLDRFNNQDAGKSGPEPRPYPFPDQRSRGKDASAKWRGKEAGRNPDWLKKNIAQEPFDLSHAVGPPMTEGRGFELSPGAAPIGDNNDDAPLRHEHAPDFAQIGVASVHMLKPMNDENTVYGCIANWEFYLRYQR